MISWIRVECQVAKYFYELDECSEDVQRKFFKLPDK